MADLLRQLLIAAVSGIILIMPAAGEEGAIGPSTAAASLSARLDRSRLYLGETTTITVTLQRGEAVVRNIRYPVVSASGAAIGEFAPPRHQEIQQDGTAVVIDEFTATVTPQKTGVTRLGPVRIDLEQLVPTGGSAGFFGETTPTPISLSAEPLDLEVLPLPTNGLPADFSGAVGRFTFSVTAKPAEIRIGNPVTVSSIISGVGNFASVKCPELISPDVKNYPPQAKLSYGALQCEQVIVPLTAGMKTLPQSRFAFFDPVTARYRTLLSEAVPLTIIDETHKNVVPDVPIVSKTGSTVRQYSSSSLWFIPPVAVITVAIFVIFVRRWCSKHSASRQFSNASARLPFLLEAAGQALSNNDVDLFYTNVFRATELISVGMLSSCVKDDLNSLNRLIVNKHDQTNFYKITALHELVARCDAVRYGCYQPSREEMRELFSCLEDLAQEGKTA